MSLIPMLFSDWWEGLDRPHPLWDQHFGMAIDADDLLDADPLTTDTIMPYRPQSRRARRRYHPFLKSIARKGRGASIMQPDKNKFQVALDISQFSPEEVTVKVVDQHVVVEAKHGEKDDEHGWVSRQFVRKYIVPLQCDIEQVESHLSSDGILTITAPRKEPLKPDSNERIVKIQYTGKPALPNSEDTSNVTSESQKDQPPQQRGQQQQQQQHQRARKGNVKG